MSEKLKPCPFCGSKEIGVVTGFSDYDFYVGCGNCGGRSQTYINLGDRTDEECIDFAIENWNRRVEKERNCRFIYADLGEGSNAWECSECKKTFYFEDGTPFENDYRYCPHCGSRITEEVRENAES